MTLLGIMCFLEATALIGIEVMELISLSMLMNAVIGALSANFIRYSVEMITIHFFSHWFLITVMKLCTRLLTLAPEQVKKFSHFLTCRKCQLECHSIDCQKTMLLREDIRAAGELEGSRAVTEPQRDKARLKLSTAGKSTCGAFLCCAVRLNTRLTGRAGSFCIHSRRAQVRRCARARRGGKAMQTALNSPRCLPVRSEVPTAHG